MSSRIRLKPLCLRPFGGQGQVGVDLGAPSETSPMTMSGNVAVPAAVECQASVYLASNRQGNSIPGVTSCGTSTKVNSGELRVSQAFPEIVPRSRPAA